MSMYDDVHREAMHDRLDGGMDHPRSGRGDPAQGDTWNDRRLPGGTQPRRSEPRAGGESPEMTAVLGPKVKKYAKGGTGGYNPLTDPQTPYNKPHNPSAGEREKQELFPSGIPLRGELTEQQQAWMKKRN